MAPRDASKNPSNFHPLGFTSAHRSLANQPYGLTYWLTRLAPPYRILAPVGQECCNSDELSRCLASYCASRIECSFCNICSSHLCIVPPFRPEAALRVNQPKVADMTLRNLLLPGCGNPQTQNPIHRQSITGIPRYPVP